MSENEFMINNHAQMPKDYFIHKEITYLGNGKQGFVISKIKFSDILNISDSYHAMERLIKITLSSEMKEIVIKSEHAGKFLDWFADHEGFADDWILDLRSKNDSWKNS